MSSESGGHQDDGMDGGGCMNVVMPAIAMVIVAATSFVFFKVFRFPFWLGAIAGAALGWTIFMGLVWLAGIIGNRGGK